MRNMLKLVFIVTVVNVFAVCASAQIMSNEVRAKKVSDATELLNNKVKPIDADRFAHAVSPFTSDLGKVNVAKVESVAEENLTDGELLNVLSGYVNPTGIFLFGGDFYLIFKEKKLKVGSALDIVYKGNEYTVTVAEITGSTYTLQYGESELQLKLK